MISSLHWKHHKKPLQIKLRKLRGQYENSSSIITTAILQEIEFLRKKLRDLEDKILSRYPKDRQIENKI